MAFRPLQWLAIFATAFLVLEAASGFMLSVRADDGAKAARESEADARRFNDDLMVKCDAVALCWANASEVWVRSEAEKLNDWQALGRKQQFVRRSLIAGPPPAPHKRAQFMKILFHDGQFDKVVDLVEKGTPTPELVGDIASASVGSGP